MSKHWAVSPEWYGEPAFIIAGGPSVAAEDLSLLRGRRVIVVNSSYEAAPWADILFFTDQRWWIAHRGKLKGFQGRLATASRAAKGDDRLLKLRRVVPNTNKALGDLGPGLALDKSSVVSNRTSLQGAMNLAVHLGARPLVLIGADMRRADDGRTHHHTPHKWQNKPGNRTWDIQMKQLELIVEPLRSLGIPVFNTSLTSRIPWWPKVKLSNFLAGNLLVEQDAPSAQESRPTVKTLTISKAVYSQESNPCPI